jgi:hypothetical protein
LLREELRACITEVLDQDFEAADGKGGASFARIKAYIVAHTDVKAMTKDMPAVEAILHQLLVPRIVRGLQ